jgi:hypothetical protein
MYCPSCGKEIPAGSSFCLHCGNRIAAPSSGIGQMPQAPIEWEYKDFVIEYRPENRGKVYIGPGGYTIPGGCLFFWQSEQGSLAKKLQSWFDKGWEPVGEVGPACYQVRTYRKWEPSIGTWVLALPTVGLALIASFNRERYQYMKATEFRLQIRRPKK